MPVKKIALLSSMLALALIFSYVESLIPFYFGVPGMKLGLANLLVVILLYLDCARDALVVNLARILLVGILFGNGYGILYGVFGGIFSFAVMFLMKKTGRFSVLGVSAAGGVSHNLGQLLVASLTVSNYRIAYYAPLLIICGCVTGCLLGFVCLEVLKRLTVKG